MKPYELRAQRAALLDRLLARCSDYVAICEALRIAGIKVA